ncbi:P-loop containing nucleoside triphosphate hydrolase protein [Choanephora cucurbitarum]|nr:P-loop containing nucleoside triphosphate hydrolase protein [Choanephora cucurbitarum]
MVDHTYSKDFRKVLQEAQPDTYLYQLKCSLPESFYEDVIGNTKAYRIKNFIPDFLYIKQDEVTKKRKIMIIDAKSSEEMTTSHQFQVASYAFFLSYLIEDIRNLEIDALGGVWLPSDPNAPVTFRIDFQLSKIRQVYIDSLVKISSDPNPEWYLNKKCATCPFINKCKADAAGTLRSIPYMNETKAKLFKQDNETDIEDLTELLGELNIESTSSSKNTSYRDYVKAFEHKKPRFLGYSTVSIARETDHAIYIYFQIDAYSKRPFVYGIEALDVHQNKVVESAYSVKYNEHLESELKTYGQFVDQFIANLMHVLDFMNNHQSRCLFYVYSDKEKKEIRNFLYNLIVSEGDDLPYIGMDRRKEIILNATKCLMVLFPDIQLLGLSGITSFPDMDLSALTSVGRFVSIERILEENVALGISGYYRLSEVIQWMSRTNKDTDSDLASALSGMSLEEATFGRWKDSGLATQELLSPGGRVICGTELLVAQRFTWLQDILSVYWDLATDYMKQHQVELYPLICAPFKWPTLQDYKHPLLAKLVFFKQLECIKSCDQLRMDRIRDLSKLVNESGASLGSLVLEFRSMTETGSQYDFFLNFSVTSFSPTKSLQEQLEKLKFDNWRRYILVPDTRDGILEAIQYSDLLYMSAGKYQKKGIRCVDVKFCKGNDICLVGSRISSRQKRWRLYERYMDFTTNQCVDALKSIDNEPFSDDIVRLINYPNQWAQENVADEMNISANTVALQLRDEFSMSPSQKHIASSIFKKRLQIVWGPPGSGKTEFLALFVNWYLKCFRDCAENKNKKLMIGVTAFTREAILNLLKRIEKIQDRHNFRSLFSILYVCDEPPNTLSSDSGIICERWDRSITTVNSIRTQDSSRIFVVGATAWKWNKIRDKWKRFEGCSMMIVDESTQLLVSDAMLAVACLKQPTGKLIIAGDHMQLGPIVKHNYSDLETTAKDPLLYGSIQQCLMRTDSNHTIPIREFILQKGASHEFGPNTLQLKDNWRMNDGLNAFFQHVYGPEYTSRRPSQKLQLDWSNLPDDTKATKRLQQIQSILDPNKPIALVKISSTSEGYDAVKHEARIVCDIVSCYLASCTDHKLQDSIDEPKVMIVTPHHQQRIAIQNITSQFSKVIKVDTVEKMQGQECDLIIACFSFAKIHTNSHEFLRDFRRWNVALSRAKCKVVVLTVESLINPEPQGIFRSFSHRLEPTDGWALLCLLQQWATKQNSDYEWRIDE